MKNFTTSDATEPGVTMFDPLTELLRNGARQLIAQAVEAELKEFLDAHAEQLLPDGRRAVVRNCVPAGANHPDWHR